MCHCSLLLDDQHDSTADKVPVQVDAVSPIRGKFGFSDNLHFLTKNLCATLKRILHAWFTMCYPSNPRLAMPFCNTIEHYRQCHKSGYHHSHGYRFNVLFLKTRRTHWVLPRIRWKRKTQKQLVVMIAFCMKCPACIKIHGSDFHVAMLIKWL